MLKKGYFMMVLVEEIPNNHLEFIKPCRYWDKLPTSTGDRRISEPSTVSIRPAFCPTVYFPHLLFSLEASKGEMKVRSRWGVV